MKKILSVMLAVFMLVSCMTFTSFAADDVTVKLNGEVVDCASYGQPATIVEGRTLVPLRAIFEALGATVEWDQTTKTVSSELDGTSIKLTIGETTLYKNCDAITIDVPARIMNGRTLVPARAIAEAYGVEVEWDGATRTVILTQAPKEEAPAVDESLMVSLSGESYTGNEGFGFTSGTAIVPEVVENPDDASDKVLFLHSEKTDGPAWTYFRANNVSYEPGAKYITYFKFMFEKNALDQDVPDAALGVCFRFADSTEDGNVKDHGVATIKAVPGEWMDVAVVYTVPETLVEGAACGFGLFGNPVNNIAMSYYIDDVSLAPYDGSAEDGIHSAESLRAAEEKAAFDINAAKGVVFDMDADKDEFAPTGCTYEYKDGHLVMTAEGEEQIDPIVNFKNAGAFTADEYNAVAVRFKAEGVAEGADHIVVYFATTADDKLSQSKSVKIDYKDLEVDSEGYYVALVQMGTNLAWEGQIAALRVDPGNSNGVYSIDKIIVVEK